jgi:hypothetical protein
MRRDLAFNRLNSLETLELKMMPAAHSLGGLVSTLLVSTPVCDQVDDDDPPPDPQPCPPSNPGDDPPILPPIGPAGPDS